MLPHFCKYADALRPSGKKEATYFSRLRPTGKYFATNP